MDRKAFADELLKTATPALRKTASFLAPRPDRLLERLAVTGALSSGAVHGASKAKAALTGNPYDGPEGTMTGALAKGVGGGLLAGVLLKALGRMHAAKRR